MTAQSESVVFSPDVVAASYRRNLDVLGRVMDGVAPEACLTRASEGGAHLNWTVGHMLSSRQYVLRVLGGPVVWPELSQLKAFGRGSEPVDTEVAATADLLRALRDSQAPLHAALRTADFGQPTDFRGMSVGEFVDFMAWHEAYHVGQAGLLRRVAGYPGAIG